MKLDEIVAWYQKKIGTYDKQQWEKTVEQKILNGLSSVQLKTAKLKTDLIDVDLVRGSTFPKAKSKQSLFTVIRLAVVRYLFLPLYAQWWVKQTSPNAFAILLALYMLQMVNWAVYTFNAHKLNADTNINILQVENNTLSKQNLTQTTADNEDENIVSLSELLIPMCLSLMLSLIHSQIVATNTASGNSKSTHRRYSNANTNNKVPRELRMRRRKKFIKIRSTDAAETCVQQLQEQQQQADALKITTTQSGCDYYTKSINNKAVYSLVEENINPNIEVFPVTSVTIKTVGKLQLDLQQNAASTSSGNKLSAVEQVSDESPKKRNVNWHSPIHMYACEKEQQTSPQLMSSSSSSSSACNVISAATSTATTSETNSPQRTEHDANAAVDASRGLPVPLRRNVCEDDGFESLNGKSSSGEDNNNSMPRNEAAAYVSVANAKLRKRLNVATANHSKNNEQEVVQTATLPNYRRNKCHMESETYQANKTKLTMPTRSSSKSSSSDIDEEGDDETELISSPNSINNTTLNYNECTTSATEWLGVTTNSEECSYSSELEQSDSYKSIQISDGDAYDAEFTPALLLNSHGVTDRISCTIWEQREIKKAQLSVLQISSCILERVESMPETNDYIYLGICFACILSLMPCFCRLCASLDVDNGNEINLFDVPKLLLEKTSFSIANILHYAFGHTAWQRTVLIIACLQRLFLSLLLFIIFAVAERTFKQRFLYAKLFSHLTSSRRARKSNLPHFRLNKVRNIKTWLSVRSYLKKRGPQRSVDVIVSAAFIVTLLLLAFLSVEWLKDSVQMHAQLNLEALLWAAFIGIYLLRFMTLGNKIHEKYRSISVLITEQINLYLQIEQKPKKKDELMVANSVLKLAADLLKELEAPFKISGLCANPYLFTTIKVVILSALSGVLSEMLGFKLKLHKIKIK